MKGLDGYPAVLKPSDCMMDSLTIKLIFSGGITGAVLNMISPLVDALIRDNVKDLVCTKLSELISDDGTAMVVDEIDPIIRTLMEQGHPDPHHSSDENASKGYVHWASSALGQAHQYIFKDNSRRLGDCFFGDKRRTETNILSSNKHSLPVPMDTILNYVTNGTGIFSIDLGTSAVLPIPSTVGSNSFFRFTRLSILGLDSLTILDMLQPSTLSNFTLGSILYFNRLDVIVAFNFCSDIQNVQVCDNNNSTLLVTLVNVTLNVDILLGAVESRLNSLHLDDLTSLDYWLSTVDFMNATSLSLQSSVEGIKIRGSESQSTTNLDSGISDLLNDFLLLFLSDYKELLNSIIYAAAQGPVRGVINEYIRAQFISHQVNYQKLRRLESDKSVSRKDDDVIKWAVFEPLSLFQAVAQKITTRDLNGFLECLTQERSNSLTNTYRTLSNPALLSSYHSKTDNQLVSGVNKSDAVHVSGLNSFYDFSILNPFPVDNIKKGYDLDSTVGLGGCDNIECNPLILHYSSNSKGHTVDTTYNNEISIDSATVSAKNLHFKLEILSELTMGAYRSLQLKEAARPECMIAVMQKLEIQSLELQLTEAILSMKSDDTTEDKILDLTKSIHNLFKLLGSDSSLRQINHFLTQYSQQAKIDCIIENGGDTPTDLKPSSSSESEGSMAKERIEWNAGFFIICVFLILGVGFLFTTYRQKKYVHVHEKDDIFEGSYSPLIDVGSSDDIDMEYKDRIDGAYHLYRRHNKEVKEFEKNPRALNTNYDVTPLCMSRELSLLTRVLLPITIIVNIALFLYSNICINAVVVIITLSSGTYSSLPESVFAFGLLGTVVSMWEAQVYPLAILVAFLSGLWPYIKLLNMACCWILPASPPLAGPSISLNSRIWILRTIEMLGKWGLLDFYVMVLMMCAFHLNLLLSVTNTQVPKALVEVLVQPNFGFFSFLLATMLSHILSHVVIACHEHVISTSVMKDSRSNNLDDSKTSAYTGIWTSRLIDSEILVHLKYLRLDSSTVGEENDGASVDIDSCNDCIDDNDKVDSDSSSSTSLNSVIYTHAKIRISERGKYLLVTLLLLTMVGIAVSTSLLSFRFEFQGLVGRLLEQEGKGKSIIAYSFDSVGWAMWEAAGLSSDSIGQKQGNPNVYGLQSQIICMQICYFLFGLLAPLLLIIVLLIVWLLPLTPLGLDTLLRMAGTVGAWSALDVFCVSIAAALLEIRQFASFMVGNSCSDIDSLSIYLLPPKAGQGRTCFDVVATLSLNFIWLLLSAFMLQVFVTLTMAVGHLATGTRERESETQWSRKSFTSLSIFPAQYSDITSLQFPLLSKLDNSDEVKDEHFSSHTITVLAGEVLQANNTDNSELKDELKYEELKDELIYEELNGRSPAKSAKGLNPEVEEIVNRDFNHSPVLIMRDDYAVVGQFIGLMIRVGLMMTSSMSQESL
eukprot:CAMPEP_0119040798 /NCGR_PEP_ID=MMETSP1177-20130426/10836_1 /TAXON_ID=2985 /ORGANISM="Ochromonas sp, Strain CCMP1899" /LENGTH=1435 /DNA_ID=CAMNT_0007006205 /DNA_START=495 /DNA_END=4805 /DNA_ORIENTATION=+